MIATLLNSASVRMINATSKAQSGVTRLLAIFALGDDKLSDDEPALSDADLILEVQQLIEGHPLVVDAVHDILHKFFLEITECEKMLAKADEITNGLLARQEQAGRFNLPLARDERTGPVGNDV